MNDFEPKTLIRMSRADYRHFVQHKLEDQMLLERIASQLDVMEIVCVINSYTWEAFTTNPINHHTLTSLRYQMKGNSHNIDEDRGTPDPMAMMKHWVTEALQREMEELEAQLANRHHLLGEIEKMTDVNDLIPHFTREAGFLHDKDQEQIITKTIALLHPELF